MLSGKGKFAPFIYNGLLNSYPIEKVIIEEDEDYELLLKRRAKKIGLVKVYGQKLFNKYVIKKLMQSSKSRIKEIIRGQCLNGANIPHENKLNIRSVNDLSTIELIGSLQPDIILVNSTRLIKKALLQAVKVPIINIHSGITPAYRGNAGAYWALVNGEPDKCGSTIHLLDAGVDTGAILYQDTIFPTTADNYLTYLFLQLAKEIEMVKKAIEDVVKDEVTPLPPSGPSKIYYEPTIWQYWYNSIIKKVK